MVFNNVGVKVRDVKGCVCEFWGPGMKAVKGVKCYVNGFI